MLDSQCVSSFFPGDLEQKFELEISPLCNQQKDSIPSIQIGEWNQCQFEMNRGAPLQTVRNPQQQFGEIRLGFVSVPPSAMSVPPTNTSRMTHTLGNSQLKKYEISHKSRVTGHQLFCVNIAIQNPNQMK